LMVYVFSNQWRKFSIRAVGIKSIFDDSSTLEKRYGLDRDVASGHRQGSELQRRESAALQQIEERFRFVAIGRQTDASLWKKTTWAIHDKKKFDSLINDLAFYVGGLNNLSDRLNLLDLQRQILRGRIQQVTDRESMALLENASSQSEGISRPIPGKNSDTPSNERAQGHVYLGTIIKDRVRVLNGNVIVQGPALSFNRYESTQALNDASVVQGDMSEKAAITFFRR
jgi:Prion-inhibition and propagation